MRGRGPAGRGRRGAGALPARVLRAAGVRLQPSLAPARRRALGQPLSTALSDALGGLQVAPPHTAHDDRRRRAADGYIFRQLSGGALNHTASPARNAGGPPWLGASTSALSPWSSR